MGPNKDEKKDEEQELFYLPPKKAPVVKDDDPYVPSDWSRYYEEDAKSRFKRKAMENPFVPAGCLITVAILVRGIWTMKTGDSELGQKMMRARVAAQGLTVGAMLLGAYYQDYKTRKGTDENAETPKR